MEEIYANGVALPFLSDESIYQAVTRHFGEETIPLLCHDERLQPAGSCRLCSVEVAASEYAPRRMLASCHTSTKAGQWIWTESAAVVDMRRTILELLITDLPQEAQQPRTGEIANPLQSLLKRYRVNSSAYPSLEHYPDIDSDHPYLRFNNHHCILCGRCVRACDEIQGQFALNIHKRGWQAHIQRGEGGSFLNSACVSCGSCVQICPTEALTDRFRVRQQQIDRKIDSVCTYCGVGCNLQISVKDETIIGIEAREDAVVNNGHLCVKGRYAFGYYNHPDRLRTPLLRKHGELVAVSWEEAFDVLADRLLQIKADFGPEAIAGISSARCTNEENYLMQKLLRIGIGSNHIDGCARVCHAPTAFGMQQTFGTGAATNSIAEISDTHCLLVIGANPTEAHPVTGSKIKQAALKGVPLIVIDPRRTELAELATLHLQLKPGSNVPLIQLLLWQIIDLDLEDKKFIDTRTEDYEPFRRQILALNPQQLSEQCGISIKNAQEAARLYAQADRAMEFHGLGVTEHYQGSRAVMLISALAMLCGHIGRSGCGVNPLRGQNNVQGAADMGVQPNLGAGYLDFTQPDIQHHYEDHYGVPIPASVGWKIPEMFNAAIEGKLKALWVIGEDLLQTDPNSCHVHHALDSLDLLVVQELFLTETAAVADLVLPACSHFEKSGTFTNGERRIQRVNQAIEPLSGCKADGQIIVEMMRRLGIDQEGYDPKLHLQEIANIVPFFAGVSWERLGTNGLQWPVTASGRDTQILHQQKFTLGRGRFHFNAFALTPELAGQEGQYPFILTTGRNLQHYNCGSMTRRTPNIELVDSDTLLINPKDADRLKISSGDRVELCSRQASIQIEARISNEVKAGVLFTTFHFPEAAINHITSGVMDLDTLTPEFKVVAVDLKRVYP